MNKFVEVTCYMQNIDKLPEETRKKFYESDCDTSYIEKNIELNVNHIMYLEESGLLYTVNHIKEKKIELKTVIATMSDGKRFYIKASSIPELKLKTVIEGKGEFE